MPKKSKGVTEKFILILVIIACCTFLTAIGKINSDDYQAIVVMALLVYGGHGAYQKWKEKRELEKTEE